MNAIYAMAIGLTVAISSFLIGGTYSIVPVSTSNAVGSFVMNRYTGRVWLCNVNTCRVIPNQSVGTGNQ